MFIKDIVTELPPFLDAGICCEIGSSPGAGKSESIDQLVGILSARDGFQWGLNKTFIATLTPVDLLGFMVPGYLEMPNEKGVVERQRISEFTMPTWMISTEGKPMNSYKRGIIVFEEWDKGEPDVKKASAEIALNGRAGRWAVHSGIARIMLVNRTIDRSGSTKNFDFIINRRIELTATADLLGWEEWALRNGIDPLFIAFATKFPTIVFSNEIPEKQGPFCTPRSLVALSKVLSRRLDDQGRMRIDSMTSEIANGAVGSAATAQLISWIRLRHETPAFEDIVRDPSKCKVPDKPDAKLMICYEAAHRCDQQSIGKVITYIKRMSAEFAVTFAKAATRRDYRLINNPAMLDWTSKNASLLNAIGGAR